MGWGGCRWDGEGVGGMVMMVVMMVVEEGDGRMLRV